MNISTNYLRLCSLAIALIISGCTNLPSEGPKASAITNSAKSANTAGFVLLPLNAEVAQYLQASGNAVTSTSFGKGTPAKANRIGVGDVLAVRIWEADPEGLFSAAGSVNQGAIPNSVVDSSGRIYIPYAGPIRVTGRTPRQVAQSIARQLSDKAVEPQVHVAVLVNASNTVSVTGQVGQSGIVPLTLGGDELLDVIAASGGTTAPSYESEVMLTRDGKSTKAYLSHIINTPSFNVYMKPDDRVHVERKPLTYSAFGAVIRKGLIEFGTEQLSILEAVGKVSGLNDNRANPAGVFVMRYENANHVKELAGEESLAGETLSPDNRRAVPVIYNIDLQDPNQYFFAQSISLRDKDVIYVANAPSVEVDKFLSILGRAVGVGLSTASGAQVF